MSPLFFFVSSCLLGSVWGYYLGYGDGFVEVPMVHSRQKRAAGAFNVRFGPVAGSRASYAIQNPVGMPQRGLARAPNFQMPANSVQSTFAIANPVPVAGMLLANSPVPMGRSSMLQNQMLLQQQQQQHGHNAFPGQAFPNQQQPQRKVMQALKPQQNPTVYNPSLFNNGKAPQPQTLYILNADSSFQQNQQAPAAKKQKSPTLMQQHQLHQQQQKQKEKAKLQQEEQLQKQHLQQQQQIQQQQQAQQPYHQQFHKQQSKQNNQQFHKHEQQQQQQNQMFNQQQPQQAEKPATQMRQHLSNKELPMRPQSIYEDVQQQPRPGFGAPRKHADFVSSKNANDMSSYTAQPSSHGVNQQQANVQYAQHSNRRFPFLAHGRYRAHPESLYHQPASVDPASKSATKSTQVNQQEIPKVNNPPPPQKAVQPTDVSKTGQQISPSQTGAGWGQQGQLQNSRLQPVNQVPLKQERQNAFKTNANQMQPTRPGQMNNQRSAIGEAQEEYIPVQSPKGYNRHNFREGYAQQQPLGSRQPLRQSPFREAETETKPAGPVNSATNANQVPSQSRQGYLANQRGFSGPGSTTNQQQAAPGVQQMQPSRGVQPAGLSRNQPMVNARPPSLLDREYPAENKETPYTFNKPQKSQFTVQNNTYSGFPNRQQSFNNGPNTNQHSLLNSPPSPSSHHIKTHSNVQNSMKGQINRPNNQNNRISGEPMEEMYAASPQNTPSAYNPNQYPGPSYQQGYHGQLSEFGNHETGMPFNQLGLIHEQLYYPSQKNDQTNKQNRMPPGSYPQQVKESQQASRSGVAQGQTPEAARQYPQHVPAQMEQVHGSQWTPQSLPSPNGQTHVSQTQQADLNQWNMNTGTPLQQHSQLQQQQPQHPSQPQDQQQNIYERPHQLQTQTQEQQPQYTQDPQVPPQQHQYQHQQPQQYQQHQQQYQHQAPRHAQLQSQHSLPPQNMQQPYEYINEAQHGQNQQRRNNNLSPPTVLRYPQDTPSDQQKTKQPIVSSAPEGNSRTKPDFNPSSGSSHGRMLNQDQPPMPTSEPITPVRQSPQGVPGQRKSYGMQSNQQQQQQELQVHQQQQLNQQLTPQPDHIQRQQHRHQQRQIQLHQQHLRQQQQDPLQQQQLNGRGMVEQTYQVEVSNVQNQHLTDTGGLQLPQSNMGIQQPTIIHIVQHSPQSQMSKPSGLRGRGQGRMNLASRLLVRPGAGAALVQRDGMFDRTFIDRHGNTITQDGSDISVDRHA